MSGGEMLSKIQSQHVFHAADVEIGYTAERAFYSVNQLHQFATTWMSHDEGMIVVKIKHPYLIKIRYTSIAFVNIIKHNLSHGGDFIIGYDYTPAVESTNQSENDAFFEKALTGNLQAGTALRLPLKFNKNEAYQLNFDSLENMLDLSGMKVTHITYTFMDKTLHDLSQLYSCFDSFAMVHHLGYPGRFLFDRGYDKSWTFEQACQNIYYHVMGDRHLTAVEVADYPDPDVYDENYVRYKSVTVTPTGNIYHPPMWKLSNYALRQVDTEKVLSVSFAENDGQQIRDHDCIKNMVEDICKNGLKIGLNRFNYFLANSSKFNSHSHYFYQAPPDKIFKIMNSFGEFERALPAKIGARVGLNASSVWIGIKLERYTIKDDIKSRDLKYNFTDGCGMMSRAFAEKLMAKYGLQWLPSAFQIRFPTMKGVLLVCADQLFDADGNEVDVIFTREMQKFVKHEIVATLDVIKYSSPVPMNLNKNLIEVLCQNAAKHSKEVKSRVEGRILQMGKDAVVNLIDNCIDPEKAFEVLRFLPKYMSYSLMTSYTKAELLQERFLRTLVQADSMFSIKRLHQKQQIPIDSSMGRVMLGVPDFWSLLEPNQVYVRYSETLDPKCKEKIVHKGSVAVTRSPLYHLGGIQFVEAVYVPLFEKMGICDVIIFPITGEMPLTEAMAKGDFDGDEYAVFWDPELMMPSSQSVPSYESAEDKDKITLDQLQEEYPKFISEFMTHKPVGVYSNNHSHLAEIFGYDHPDVIKAANKNEDALVYFKSGIAPEEPTIEERVHFVQEHMRKDHLPSFNLDNVLSKNHQLFREHFEDIEAISKTDETHPVHDPKIDVPGWEIYVDEARTTYHKFVLQIKRIIEPYGPLTMAEVFSGKISEFKKACHNKDDSDSLTSIRGLIQTGINGVMRKQREAFLDAHVVCWFADMRDKEQDVFSYYAQEMPIKLQQLAVACYKVAYDDGECLAFPWVLWDVLDHVRGNSPLRNLDLNHGLFQGADPSCYIPSDNLVSSYSGTEDTALQDFFGCLYHLRKLTEMKVSNSLFEGMLIGFKTKYLNDKFGRCPQHQQLEYITLFIRTIACSNDGFNPAIKKIFQSLYLQLAFQRAPQIFLNPFKKTDVVKLQRFTVKTSTLLTDQMMDALEKTVGCQVRYRNISKRKEHFLTYALLGYGSTSSIRKLREFLSVKIVNPRQIKLSDWQQHLIKASTEQMTKLLPVPKKGYGAVSVPQRKSFFGESTHKNVSAGWGKGTR